MESCSSIELRTPANGASPATSRITVHGEDQDLCAITNWQIAENKSEDASLF